jgi:predicted ATP-grasp superfamily ATP-dependent carboligase/peptidoglycan/xylan/chitin deacetylase (PgdA/CDA1 family)
MKEIRQPPADVLNRAPRSHRVLAVCGDTQVGLWMVRSLGRAGLTVFSVCATERGLAAKSRYSSGVWTLEHSPNEEAFVGEIKELCERLDAGSVMTIAEEYHEAFIRNRHQLEPDVHVFSPSADTFGKAIDKDYTHALCGQIGVPVARGTTLDALMANFGEHNLKFPVVLRTKKWLGLTGPSQAPWKAAYAKNPEHLGRLYDQVKGIASNVLVQEYHPGVEDHVQVLMHKGEPFMVGEYIGDHHMPLAGGVTVQRVSCHHDNVIRDAARLLQAIGWDGVAGVQFHYDPVTGKHIFLEINPRFIGGLPTVILAGFDAPFLLWQSQFEPEKMKRTAYRLGLRTRILGGDANWVLAMIRGDPLPPDQERLGKASTVLRFLWNLGPWTKSDVFYWKDPKPIWADVRLMAAHLHERSVDLIGKTPKTEQGSEGWTEEDVGMSENTDRDRLRAKVKRAFYQICKWLGLFHVARRLTRDGLRILCYHGLSVSDEHRFNPLLFMRPETLRARLAYLANNAFPVISLDDAVAGLSAGTLPDCATVLTFDDGFGPSHQYLPSLLEELGFPATLYVTTYYCVKETPVFRLVVQYMFWKTPRKEVDLTTLPGNTQGRVSLETVAMKKRLAWEIIRHGENACDGVQRGDLMRRLGELLDVKYEAVLQTNAFNILTRQEVRELAAAGVDIQLHTHRHQLPLDETKAKKEVMECRAVLEPLVQKPLKHFCYPSGFWSEKQWRWLAAVGVETGTTCDIGLDYPRTPRLALKRLLDGEDRSQIEFEAEMCGLAEIMRWIRAVFGRSAP